MPGPAGATPAGVLAAQLRSLGVAPGDTLCVHASLRRLGPVPGGAAGVLDALRSAVGADGTLLFPVGARDDWAWVNERPESERAALLAGSPPFDPWATPADPEVGVLAEVFRTSPGTLVSDHPEGRFAAAGPGAAALLADVPWDDYYGPGSPLERLVDGGGRVLRLGADPGTVTLLHLAEYRARVPGARRVRRHRLVGGAGGPEVRVVDCLDDSDGIVPYPGDYFAVILRAYLAAGRARRGPVGHTTGELLEGGDVVRFGADWMERHLRGT